MNQSLEGALSCRRVFVALWFLLCAHALAEDTTNTQICEDHESYRYIRKTEPSPNGPLRQDNITDEEVREIEHAALEVYPDSIVSISGVTEGCDCEDGSSCTARVWLALFRDDRTRGLVLSKIEGHWRISAVQSWLLQFNAHQKRNPGRGSGAREVEWQQENQRLLDNFPTCPAAPAVWTLLRTESGGFAECVDMYNMQVTGAIRRVHVKYVQPPVRLKSTRHYPSLKYNVDLVAFDCKQRRLRVDEIDSYHDDNRLIKGPGDDPVLWRPIRSETASADWDLVCGSAAK